MIYLVFKTRFFVRVFQRYVSSRESSTVKDNNGLMDVITSVYVMMQSLDTTHVHRGTTHLIYTLVDPVDNNTVRFLFEYKDSLFALKFSFMIF